MKSAPDSPAGGTAGVMHTPGPWRVLDYSDGNKGFIAIVGPGEPAEHIADTFPFGKRPGASDRELQQHQANARLIAAVPDMLAELRRLHERYGEQATADVIAKATASSQ